MDLNPSQRVHAVIPPLSLCDSSLNIRKFSPVPFTPEELLARGKLEPRAQVLAACDPTPARTFPDLTLSADRQFPRPRV